VTVVLVEGDSDKAAVETLAPRLGVDLGALGADVVAIGGAGNVGRRVREATASGQRVGGLYDEAEERFVARALGRQVGDDLTRQGFFACHRDLEDEFIRAIGPGNVLELLAAERDLDAFRILQRQPAHREREVGAQLRRFLGTTAGRKIRYGTVLATAVPLERVPEPIAGLLAWL